MPLSPTPQISPPPPGSVKAQHTLEEKSHGANDGTVLRRAASLDRCLEQKAEHKCPCFLCRCGGFRSICSTIQSPTSTIAGADTGNARHGEAKVKTHDTDSPKSFDQKACGNHDGESKVADHTTQQPADASTTATFRGSWMPQICNTSCASNSNSIPAKDGAATGWSPTWRRSVAKNVLTIDPTATAKFRGSWSPRIRNPTAAEKSPQWSERRTSSRASYDYCNSHAPHPAISYRPRSHRVSCSLASSGCPYCAQDDLRSNYGYGMNRKTCPRDACCAVDGGPPYSVHRNTHAPDFGNACFTQTSLLGSDLAGDSIACDSCGGMCML